MAQVSGYVGFRVHLLKQSNISIREVSCRGEKVKSNKMNRYDFPINGYTRNGAYQLRMENEIGSIEAGKDADIVVLGEDLFEADPYTLHKIRPEAVVMEGELIWGALR